MNLKSLVQLSWVVMLFLPSQSFRISPSCWSQSLRPRACSRQGWRMQVWSNPQALEEYQDLLSGKEQVASVDTPSVIVGGGRVGEMLRGAGGGDDGVVGRGGQIPEMHEGLESFPVYVCVPTSELENVIRSCPQSKLDDLVFVQDGMIEPILKKYALCGNENTQMLPYFTLFSKGGRPQDSLVVRSLLTISPSSLSLLFILLSQFLCLRIIRLFSPPSPSSAFNLVCLINPCRTWEQMRTGSPSMQERRASAGSGRAR